MLKTGFNNISTFYAAKFLLNFSAFLDKESERYLRGVLDLVFLWKGAVYVVDWKTNDVKGNTLEEVVRREYDLQHQMYMDSAIKAFVPEFRYGGFFFVFVRHLHHGGIIPGGALCTQTR